MYKSLLLLCLVGVVCAQENITLDDLIKSIFINNLESTEATVNNVQNPVTIVPPVSQPQDSDSQPCTTEDGEEGICVTYYLCVSNNTVNVDEVGIIDIHVQADKCYSYLDVCCNVRDLRSKDNPITPRPEIRKEGCGWRNPDGIGFKTIDDTDGESQFGEFPWMVAILK